MSTVCQSMLWTPRLTEWTLPVMVVGVQDPVVGAEDPGVARFPEGVEWRVGGSGSTNKDECVVG